MSRAVRRELESDDPEGPVMDTQFEIEGVTFVKPAPPIGAESDFYPHGRPRTNTTGIEICPTISLTIPKLTRNEWSKIRHVLPSDKELCDNYQDWLRQERSG